MLSDLLTTIKATFKLRCEELLRPSLGTSLTSDSSSSVKLSIANDRPVVVRQILLQLVLQIFVGAVSRILDDRRHRGSPVAGNLDLVRMILLMEVDGATRCPTPQSGVPSLQVLQSGLDNLPDR